MYAFVYGGVCVCSDSMIFWAPKKKSPNSTVVAVQERNKKLPWEIVIFPHWRCLEQAEWWSVRNIVVEDSAWTTSWTRWSPRSLLWYRVKLNPIAASSDFSAAEARYTNYIYTNFWSHIFVSFLIEKISMIQADKNLPLSLSLMYKLVLLNTDSELCTD